MIEKYRMTKEKRIEMYGERLLALQDELAKRDLSQIPTNKLFDMTMKCSRALQQEIEMPQFLTEEDIKEKKMRREIIKKKQEQNEFLEKTMLAYDILMQVGHHLAQIGQSRLYVLTFLSSSHYLHRNTTVRDGIRFGDIILAQNSLQHLHAEECSAADGSSASPGGQRDHRMGRRFECGV